MARATHRDAAPAPAPAPTVAVTSESTVTAADYIGPDACGACHPAEHAKWQQSLHRVMNQRAEDAGAIIGDFATTLEYGGGSVTFAHDAAAYTMTVRRGHPRDGNDDAITYRVTRTIGQRSLQEYVGIADGTTTEVRLPFAWWPRRRGWFPQPYFDPWLAEADVDPYARVTEPWAERCPWCHSTYPFEQRLARGGGHGVEQFVASDPASGAPAVPAAGSVHAQVTVGISCESCHLGGRAHAATGAAMHFLPGGVTLAAAAPARAGFAVERTTPAIVNAVCTQCHSGPSPRWPDRSSTRNSSEGLDLAASPCTTARCIDCHDPHTGGADEPRAIAACIRCHAPLGDATAAAEHAGAGHATVSCLDCHMPRVVMGVDRFVRSHRISAPTDRAQLAAGAPNACGLCHLDRSIRWTLAALRARYHVQIAAHSLDAGHAYPDLDAPVGAAWLASKQPFVRIAAAAAYARFPLTPHALPALLAGLDDELPHVRAWTAFAVETILGRTLATSEYDPRAPGPRRRAHLELLADSVRRNRADPRQAKALK